MLSKSAVLAGVTTALLGFSMSASAVVDPPTEDFTGAYAVGNWTQSLGDGLIDLTGAPNAVTLTSGNAGSPSLTSFTIAASSAATVSFNWSYSTAENANDDGSPANDQAIFLLGSTPIALSNNGASPIGDGSFSPQNGVDSSFSVLNGQVFGFSVDSTDGCCGAATLTISNFKVSPVPEPGSLAMLTAGLMVVVAARKRKQPQS